MRLNDILEGTFVTTAVATGTYAVVAKFAPALNPVTAAVGAVASVVFLLIMISYDKNSDSYSKKLITFAAASMPAITSTILLKEAGMLTAKALVLTSLASYVWIFAALMTAWFVHGLFEDLAKRCCSRTA